MKKNLLFLTVLSALVLSSCQMHAPVPKYGDEIRFVVKKSLFGQDLYGLERKNFSDGSWNLTIEPKYEEISTTVTYFADDSNTGKQKTFTSDDPNLGILIGKLDGKDYYHDKDGFPFCLGEAVKEMHYIGELFNDRSCMGPGGFIRLITVDNNVFIYRVDEGVWNFQFSPGPYREIELGIWGFAFQESTGWGFKYKIEGSGRPVELIPAEYDEILEVHDEQHRFFKTDVVFLARKGNVWSGVDRQKKPVNVSPATVKTLQSFPFADIQTLGSRNHGKRAGIVIIV